MVTLVGYRLNGSNRLIQILARTGYRTLFCVSSSHGQRVLIGSEGSGIGSILGIHGDGAFSTCHTVCPLYKVIPLVCRSRQIDFRQETVFSASCNCTHFSICTNGSDNIGINHPHSRKGTVANRTDGYFFDKVVLFIVPAYKGVTSACTGI